MYMYTNEITTHAVPLMLPLLIIPVLLVLLFLRIIKNTTLRFLFLLLLFLICFLLCIVINVHLIIMLVDGVCEIILLLLVCLRIPPLLLIAGGFLLRIAMFRLCLRILLLLIQMLPHRRGCLPAVVRTEARRSNNNAITTSNIYHTHILQNHKGGERITHKQTTNQKSNKYAYQIVFCYYYVIMLL